MCGQSSFINCQCCHLFATYGKFHPRTCTCSCSIDENQAKKHAFVRVTMFLFQDFQRILQRLIYAFCVFYYSYRLLIFTYQYSKPSFPQLLHFLNYFYKHQWQTSQLKFCLTFCHSSITPKCRKNKSPHQKTYQTKKKKNAW